jgi:hypothetical protein
MQEGTSGIWVNQGAVTAPHLERRWGGGQPEFAEDADCCVHGISVDGLKGQREQQINPWKRETAKQGHDLFSESARAYQSQTLAALGVLITKLQRNTSAE